MKLIAAAIALVLPFMLSAQIELTGTVLDAETGEPLIGAYVISGAAAAVVDEQGSFILVVDGLPATLTISFIGYVEQKIEATSEAPLDIRLSQESNVLDIMTVTASKYERRLSESTVSVEVLKPDLINSVNTIDIDAALDKVPGVQMIDGQANIRGGSGYSYGAGSRVLLLLDDVPALQVDAGFPNWNDIPVENIAQVEVLKGAASALYGSSALNGIINIRTGSPTATPQTKFAAGYTVFGDAPNPAAQWWGDSTRYQYNISLLHKQKFGKLDVVAGAFVTKLESFNRFTFQNRRRANLKLQYQLTDKAFIRVNSLINRGDNGDFFVWSNDSTGIYEPAFGSPATSKNLRYFIDPSVHIEDGAGNSHKLLTRLHYINNDNNDAQSNTSSTRYLEYQFQRRLGEKGPTITAGAVTISTSTDAELFGDTTFSATNYGVYGQLEHTFFEKLNASAGLRYEYNRQRTPESFNGIEVPGGEISEGKPVARLGLSYEYAPYSSVRASWGQGYRFPTITEKFITTQFAGFQILPSPDLQSEFGWTAELGVKQGFQVGTAKGYVDAAVFTSEYTDMTEFTFGTNGGQLGFASLNVGDTRITGIDLALFAAADIGPVAMSAYGGYTYIHPIYQNFETDSVIQSGISTDENFLKYRVAHSMKMDLQFGYKGFTLGGAFTYASHVINIDRPLERFEYIGPVSGQLISLGDILGIKSYRDRNNKGFARLDLRASYTYQAAKFSFLVNNVANTEYAARPGLLEAPRSYSVRLDYTFDWK